MPTTTSIFIGSRFAGVSARNDRFPRLSEVAACRYLLDLPESSRRAGRIAMALALVPRIKGGGYEVGQDQNLGQATRGVLGVSGLPTCAKGAA